MASLTLDQLKHLASLTALHLSDEELQSLLPEMQNILGFVGRLQELDLADETVDLGDEQTRLREGVGDPLSREGFFGNIQHPITDHMLTIQTSTNQKREEDGE